MENKNLKEEENSINQNTNSNTTILSGTTITIDDIQPMYGPAPLELRIVNKISPYYTIILCFLGFFVFVNKKLSKKLKIIIITILSLLFISYFVLYIIYHEPY